MEIGIIGLAQSGESTLFEIMTGVRCRAVHGDTVSRGLATVPDIRFDHLVEVFRPAKISPAKVPFLDVHATGGGSWEAVRQSLSGTDALLHVIDGFAALDAEEAVRHYRHLEDDLILSDLMIVENRLERLARMPKKVLKPPDASHQQILPRLKEHLEGGSPLRDFHLTAEEAHALRSFSFWTIRPEVVVVNLGEDDLSLGDGFCQEADISAPVMGICCRIEAELADLTPVEGEEYLASLGIAESAFGRVIREAYALLDQICYFTVGEDEVKAWIIPAGTKAPHAAAAIHKDFERGFIKAEVVSYEDFIACGESLSAAKAAGRLRLEGKEYVVQDGDIISFRFNV